MSNKPVKKIDENPAVSEKGFSLIEAVVAILIITVGLIGTAAAITYALEYGAISRNVGNAKLVIVSSIEEIESLRNTRRLDFKQIANVGKVDNNGSPNTFGGFSNGYKEVSVNPGPDGVNGTNDDLRDAGPDETYGTGDDFDNPSLVKSGYVREIIITDLNTTLKKVEIKVR
jgi:type II secretory pathway pseudopilin PulG